MSISVSKPQNIGSPRGNSLAVFKDATTSQFFVKDIYGNLEQLALGGGSVTGTGTTNKLPVWSDGANGVLSDSIFLQNAGATTGQVVGNLFVTVNTETDGQVVCGKTQSQDTDISLDVKRKSTFRGGVVISPVPGGVQVDNSSLIVGAGNNDIITGSDHCIGSGNNVQITNSDCSIAVGQTMVITDSNNSACLGSNSSIFGSNSCGSIGANNRIGRSGAGYVTLQSHAVGNSNLIESQSNIQGSLGFIFGHDNTIQNLQQNSFALGFSNSITTQHRNVFMIGGDLAGVDETMNIGYRNNVSEYPAQDNPQGLGQSKIILSAGGDTNTNSNAMIITEGGVNVGGVAQVPRIVFPTLVGFDFTSDTDAGNNGIPVGGLYHNSGQVFVRTS